MDVLAVLVAGHLETVIWEMASTAPKESHEAGLALDRTGSVVVGKEAHSGAS